MKIYIGGISPEVNDSELLDLYSQYGKVKKVDLLKDETGLNRGYAFIEMDDPQAAESAILGTNNTLLGSNNIQVSISRSRLDQKRERQKKSKSNNNGGFRNNNNRPQKPNNQNNSRNTNRNSNRNHSKNSYDQGNNDDDRYNRIDRPAPIKKGVDYGRNNNNGNPPKMSFLGQEDFATSIRTVDPLYSSNQNNRRENSNGYRGNNNKGRNNFNKNRRFNSSKKFDKDHKKENKDSIFQPNTSDIIGNLE